MAQQNKAGHILFIPDEFSPVDRIRSVCEAISQTQTVSRPTYQNVQKQISKAGSVVLVAGLPKGELIFSVLEKLAGVIPILIVTNQSDPVRAARAVRTGGEVYLQADDMGLKRLSSWLRTFMHDGTSSGPDQSPWSRLASLQRVQRQYDALFDNMLNGFSYHRIILDSRGVPFDFEYLSANKELERLTGLNRQEIIGRTIRETQPGFMQNDGDLMEVYGRVALTGEPISIEYYSRNLDRWMEIRAYSPEKYYFATLFNDITERKRTELKMQRLLDQKTTLLKEVHHRVKNNMQIIASLLNLQQANVPEELVDIIQESQDRVQSLSLVHEKLYQTQDYGNIDLTGYLHDLATNLVETAGNATVQLNVSGRACPVDPQAAVVCGLIVTEAITNSTKYAFPSERTSPLPRIQLSIRRYTSTVRLEIADNGVGFTYDPDNPPASLGLTLIHELTRQIKGTLSIDATEGTRIVIKMPIAAPPGDDAEDDRKRTPVNT